MNAQGLTRINFPQLLFFFLLLVEMEEDSLSAYPLLDFKGKPNAVDELVCFQEAQTLPLFLIVPKTNPTFTPTTVKPPFNLVSQAPLSPLASSTQNAGIRSSSSPPISSTMTRAAFEQFDTDMVLSYLTSQGVKLDDREQGILRDQKIDGEALLSARKDDLERAGIPTGVVLRIFRVIPSSEKVSRERILFYALAVLVSLVAILLGFGLR